VGVHVDAEDLDVDLAVSPTLTTSCGVLDLVVGQLGDVQQAFEVRLELDEDAEVGDLRDRARDACPGLW
jgi:hypothetical protein